MLEIRKVVRLSMDSSKNRPHTATPYAHFKHRTYALTHRGKELFLERLKHLAYHRDTILEQIRTLKEQQADAPLDFAAKFAEMQQIDNEMYRLDAILARSEALAVRGTEVVHEGSRVTLVCQGRETHVVLVNSVEADPSNGFISCESPIGKLLVGRHPGETVVFGTPRTKQKTYRIIATSQADI